MGKQPTVWVNIHVVFAIFQGKSWIPGDWYDFLSAKRAIFFELSPFLSGADHHDKDFMPQLPLI